MSRYHFRLTRDSASMEGRRTEGSSDNHTNTNSGKKTAKLMYRNTNSKDATLNLPKS